MRVRRRRAAPLMPPHGGGSPVYPSRPRVRGRVALKNAAPGILINASAEVFTGDVVAERAQAALYVAHHLGMAASVHGDLRGWPERSGQLEDVSLDPAPPPCPTLVAGSLGAAHRRHVVHAPVGALERRELLRVGQLVRVARTVQDPVLTPATRARER